MKGASTAITIAPTMPPIIVEASPDTADAAAKMSANGMKINPKAP
jgi:hypothetical protein